jgi:hypothetical protein
MAESSQSSSSNGVLNQEPAGDLQNLNTPEHPDNVMISRNLNGWTESPNVEVVIASTTREYFKSQSLDADKTTQFNTNTRRVLSSPEITCFTTGKVSVGTVVSPFHLIIGVSYNKPES